MKNQDLRDKFDKLNLNYSMINKESIINLCSLINNELELFNNDGFTMKIRCLRLNDSEYRLNGSLVKCFLMVGGHIDHVSHKVNHFFRREAISFNQQDKKGIGFIGFAGWADSTNVQPFLIAFDKWLNLYYS